MQQESDEELDVETGYAAWATTYDDDGNPLIAIEGPAVMGWIQPRRDGLALDLGCGTGRHTQSLVEAGFRVWALDQSTEMMARAKAKCPSPRVSWVRHNLGQPLPLSSSTFDVIVLGLVIEHLQELSGVFGELARVLAPGGRCIASALHPDRTGAGQRARFIDPSTGLRRPIKTYHHTIDEYLRAGTAAGLTLEGEQSLVVTAELGTRLPRAIPYEGRSLGWVGCWSLPPG